MPSVEGAAHNYGADHAYAADYADGPDFAIVLTVPTGRYCQHGRHLVVTAGMVDIVSGFRWALL